MLPHSAAGKRRIKIAKDHDAYIDMTYGRSLKCLLMMDDGQVVGCGLTTKTMLARLMTRDTPEDRKDDENGENDTIE